MDEKKGKILSLDLAIRTSGYAILNNGKLIKSGTFTTTYTTSVERIKEVRNAVILLLNCNPDYVVFEDIQLQKNVNTFKILAKLQGVIEDLLFDSNVKYSITKNSTWRKRAGVKGRKSKEQKQNAQLKVHELFNVDVKEDEADAILLGYTVKEEDFDNAK